MEVGLTQDRILPKRIKLNNKEINAPMEMMVKDYDDDRTLDSEEALEEGAEEQSNQQKTIMVGSDYQAFVPEGLWKYDDVLPYENEDKQLWDPSNLSLEEIEAYMVKAQEPLVNNTLGVNAIPVGVHTRDDEQALYLLLQCGYNMEEALRRRRMNVVPPTDTMSLWSEEECRHFENGLRNFGKNFHVIQQNKVRTRSVGELVQFYYLWKKTERHDVFANKARLEKKKYTLHPGVTYVGIRDYMDRFCDEQESGSSGLAGAGSRDRSSSPNIQCLIYGDPKRQHRVSESLSHFDKDGHEVLAASFSTGDGNDCSLETGVGLSSLKSSCVSDNVTSAASLFITSHQTMAQ